MFYTSIAEIVVATHDDEAEPKLLLTQPHHRTPLTSLNIGCTCCKNISKLCFRMLNFENIKQADLDILFSSAHTIRDVCIFEINGMEVFL